MLIPIIESLRPKQWLKNLFVFAALAFSRNFTEMPLLLKTLEASVVFCLLSSACYIINDILDAKADRLHPIKSRRPIASGRLPILPALIVATILLAVSLGWAAKLSLPINNQTGLPFFHIVMAYALLQILYSLALKKVIILDALVIATGFVLRMVAGAVAINIAISSWLYICTISLSLFIAFSKRRAEMTVMETPESHRPVLGEYSPYLLDQMISSLTASTIMAYTLYTLAEETVAKLGSQNMLLTIPFVVYGIFRYLYLVHHKQQGGEPENIILADKPLLIDILAWVTVVIIILY
ncbi:MAG: decaprenyl-phosphate phosphoribosyltransferase [Planctomycetes bacterium]|nr:decaprenyl-phosphate phosphoribosyltransferase [Planctomycetota bacterium]